MSDADLEQPIDHRWIRIYAPHAICALGMLPRIPLPNSDRDCGDWSLGIDRKHEGSTVLLYCNFGKPNQEHRRIASITTRRQLIALYDQLCGWPGAWVENNRREVAKEARAWTSR